MVRSELLQKFCNQHPQLLKRDAEKIFEIIFSEILEALSRGDNVEIRGFGTYKAIKRKVSLSIKALEEKQTKEAVKKYGSKDSGGILSDIFDFSKVKTKPKNKK